VLAVISAAPALAADAVKVGFITKFPVPFFATMENAAKEYAAANPGVEIVYGQGASATDIEGQIGLIESMVAQGVQGIALTPVDPTVATALDKAVAAGIKVVLMDNNIPDWNGRTALATTDNYAAGKIAGEYLATVLKAGDTMGILEGVPGVPALDDRVNGMIEKPGAANRPSNLVSLVAHVHADAASLMQAIEAQYKIAATPDDHYERAMDALMPDHIFKVARYRGHWSALKYPWHVLDIMDYFLSQIKGQTVEEGAFVHKNAALVGDVFIAAGAKVFPGAAVVGPAYIGRDTIVGNNALVRASMVLDRCEVGYTTEVARSYVADHCSMHACRVLDSVFAPNVNFSAGCTTANLRMDRGNVSMRVKGEKLDTGRGKLGAVIGQGAFLGVDVMTMPGLKIGEGAQVGPGVHVYSDLDNKTRLLVKQSQTIEPID